MSDLSVLNEQIERLRNKLHEVLSDEKMLTKNEVVECSQKLDKLITKYCSAVNMTRKVT